jgi:nicotinate-nucleotide--dimethylbenzimidazole phosphoribosyltransferase
LCYHCGAEIDKGANQCPQCNKLQEPPINPDSLLEMRETKREMAREPQPQAPSPAPQPPAREPEAPAQEIVAPAREVRANADLETLAADLERFVMPSPNVPAPMRPPVHQMPTDFVIPKPPERTFSKPDASILSAKELAAAFQLEFQPQAAAPAGPIAPAPTKPEKKSHPILRTFLLLIFLAAIGAVTFFGLKPGYRDQALAWIQTNYQKVRSSLVAKNPTTPAMSTQNQTATAQPTPDETPLHPPEEITQPKPAPAPQPAPLVAQQQPAQPAPQVETPKPQPQPQPPAVVEDTKPQAPQMSWDDAYAQYKKLWVEALEAEGNKDYPLAIQKYEEIHKLRSDVWPKDLNERIAAAKTHLP